MQGLIKSDFTIKEFNKRLKLSAPEAQHEVKFYHKRI